MRLSTSVSGWVEIIIIRLTANMTGVEHITMWSLFKNLSYVAVFIASIEWLGFNPQALTIFAILMVIDVCTGIARVCINDGCKHVKSTIGINGVLKKILLLTALLAVALASKGTGFEADRLVQAAVYVLTLGELYSILGNIHSARTGNPKVEFDAVSYLLSKVGETLIPKNKK